MPVTANACVACAATERAKSRARTPDHRAGGTLSASHDNRIRNAVTIISKSTRGADAMTHTVILGGARTPFGVLGGSLKEKSATELGAVAIRSALARSGVAPTDVDNVLMGMVVQAGAGQIPSRQASLGAGLP